VKSDIYFVKAFLGQFLFSLQKGFSGMVREEDKRIFVIYKFVLKTVIILVS
jgi:hypothetical protein